MRTTLRLNEEHITATTTFHVEILEEEAILIWLTVLWTEAHQIVVHPLK